MKKIFAGLLVIMMTALFGCGGSNDSSPGGAVTATGKFVDAPVAGLMYVSGSQSGVTGVDGSFTYEVGQKVKFTIGDIVLGEVTGEATITPITLSATIGADQNTPDVVARVQLLMSVSSTDPSTGIITIPPTILTAAHGKTINFASATLQSDLQAMVGTLSSGKILVTSSEAKIHFVNTLATLASSPSTGFSAVTLAGKTVNIPTSGGTIGYTFSSTGGITTNWGTAGTYSGSWTVDTTGKLIVSLPTYNHYPSIFVIQSVNGNSLTINFARNDSPTAFTETTTWTLPTTLPTTVPTTTPIITVSAFTTAMLAGHTLIHTMTSGTATYTFSSTGSTYTVTGKGAGSGTWSIDADGELLINATSYPVGTSYPSIFRIVSANGNNLTVQDAHNDTPTTWEPGTSNGVNLVIQ